MTENNTYDIILEIFKIDEEKSSHGRHLSERKMVRVRNEPVMNRASEMVSVSVWIPVNCVKVLSGRVNAPTRVVPRMNPSLFIRDGF